MSGLACCALALSACGGGSDTAGTAGASSVAATELVSTTVVARSATNKATSVTQPANTVGRLLASNCFQCHGTLGLGGFEKIRGSDAAEVMEYLTKPASSNIMAAHAQGYTREQLQAIVAYLQQ